MQNACNWMIENMPEKREFERWGKCSWFSQLWKDSHISTLKISQVAWASSQSVREDVWA